MSHFSQRFILALVLGLSSLLARAAEPALERVRIASIGIVKDGEVEVTSQSARVAQDGWLQAELGKRGIALEWVPVASALGGPGFNEGLAKKTVDFASYGDLPALIGRSGSLDIRLIVPYGGGTNAYLVVPSDSTATSISDLKGKRIALHRGRPAELPFTKLIAGSGLRLNDLRILNLNSQAGAAALAAGNVQGYFAGSEAYLLVEKGVGKIIWSNKQIDAGRQADFKARVELFVRSEFAERYPEVTQLVASAYVRAAHWTAQDDHRDAVVALNARPGIPAWVVAADYADEPWPWRDRWSPLFDDFLRHYYRESIDLAVQRNLLRKGVELDSFFDERFVAQALKDLDLGTFWTPRPGGDTP